LSGEEQFNECGTTSLFQERKSCADVTQEMHANAENRKLGHAAVARIMLSQLHATARRNVD
jgi:hypothetical protein